MPHKFDLLKHLDLHIHIHPNINMFPLCPNRWNDLELPSPAIDFKTICVWFIYYVPVGRCLCL